MYQLRTETACFTLLLCHLLRTSFAISEMIKKAEEIKCGKDEKSISKIITPAGNITCDTCACSTSSELEEISYIGCEKCCCVLVSNSELNVIIQLYNQKIQDYGKLNTQFIIVTSLLSLVIIVLLGYFIAYKVCKGKSKKSSAVDTLSKSPEKDKDVEKMQLCVN